MPEPTLVDEEPVRVFVAGLALVLSSGLALAATFDWVPLDATQAASLIAFVTVAAVFVAKTLRARVKPFPTV